MSKKGKKPSRPIRSVDAVFAAKLIELAGILVERQLSYAEFGAMHVGAAAMSVQAFVERLLIADQFEFDDTCSTRGSQWRKYCADKNSSATAFHMVAKRFLNIFDEIDNKIFVEILRLGGGAKNAHKVALLQEKRAYFYRLGEKFTGEYFAYACQSANETTRDMLDRLTNKYGIDFGYWLNNVFDDDFCYLLVHLNSSAFYRLECLFRSLLFSLRNPEKEYELREILKFFMRSTGSVSRLALLRENILQNAEYSP